MPPLSPSLDASGGRGNATRVVGGRSSGSNTPVVGGGAPRSKLSSVSSTNAGTPREQGSRHSSVGASSDLNRARREKLKEVKRKSEERKEQMRDHERRLRAMKQGVKARVQVRRRKGL